MMIGSTRCSARRSAPCPTIRRHSLAFLNCRDLRDLSFPQRTDWGLGSSEMWHCVARSEFCDVSKKPSTLKTQEYINVGTRKIPSPCTPGDNTPYGTWCFSDRASWIDNILITNLMHWLLFIHKILFSPTCFEPQVLIFRRIQLYTCSIWYCHSLWEFLVACRYTAWVRTVLTQAVYRQATTNCDSTICCIYTTVSSWRWALKAWNV